MDTGLFILSLLAALYTYLLFSEYGRTLPFIFALAALTLARPEGIIAAAIFVTLALAARPPLVLSEAQQSDFTLATEAILAWLRRVTHARRDLLLGEFGRRVAAGKAERHTRESDPPELKQPRALLILDNVDQPALLGATQVALLPPEEWLEIVVTTRLDPARFDGGDRAFAHVEVSVLPEPDAR